MFRLLTAQLQIYFHDKDLFKKSYDTYGISLKREKTVYMLTYEETFLQRRKLQSGKWSCGSKMDDSEKPCHIISIKSGVLGTQEWDLNPDLTVFYSRLINQHHEKELYHFTEMVGESGGYVGVILGYSFLDVSALGKMALERFYLRMREGIKY